MLLTCSNTAAACQGGLPAHRFLREVQAQLCDDEGSVWVDVTITNMHRLADATGYLRARWMLEEAEEKAKEEAGEELHTTSWLQGTYACLLYMLGLHSSCLVPRSLSPDWAQPCLLGQCMQDASACCDARSCACSMCAPISMQSIAVCCTPCHCCLADSLMACSAPLASLALQLDMVGCR